MLIEDFILTNWKTILEIAILWGVFYVTYLLLEGTAAEEVLKGVIVIAIVVMISRQLDLAIINWLLTRLLAISVLAFIIIFQPEMRRGLASIGRFGIFSREKEMIEEVAKAAVVLSKRGVGALIAIERETGLRRYVESGVEVDSLVTSELLNTIFTQNTPLHDGGVIVSGQRVEAAACLFPLTQNPNVPKTLGTRHRAAIGLSEETDAVVLVVSEETGSISVAVNGRMTRELAPKDISKFLEGAAAPKIRKLSFFNIFGRRLSKKQE